MKRIIKYKINCKCGDDCIGETRRITIKRWSEQDNPTKDSEPPRHLKKHINHVSPGKFFVKSLKGLISVEI